MTYPKRPITDAETARANSQPVAQSDLSRDEIAATLAAFNYSELEAAKEHIKATSNLAVGDIYIVWGAISNALDHHTSEEQQSLEQLESDCAEVVTSAWDNEMELSDRAERQQNVTSAYHAPAAQPASDSVALMLKKIAGSLEWVALAIFILAIAQCAADRPKHQHDKANAVSAIGLPVIDAAALLQLDELVEAIKASKDKAEKDKAE